jgi:hypothetical protein
MSNLVFHRLIPFTIFILWCGSGSLSDARASNWPFEIKGHLGDSDTRAIVALVQSRSGLVSEHIWQLEVTKPGSVEVALGYRERLGGELLQVEKHRDRWRIIFVGVWGH